MRYNTHAGAASEPLTRMRAATVLVTGILLICGCSGEFPANPAAVNSATDAYDEERLLKSLETIKAWHLVNGTGVDAALRPGLTGSALTPRLFSGQCRLTEELKALWSWHDGEQSAVPFTWYHDFLSLEDAVSEYRWLLLNPLVQWDPTYIPILSFEGEWYAAYCGASSEIAGPVIHYFLEDGARVTAINLTTFMASMAQALEREAVRWIDGGMVEDIRQIEAIHRAHNPGYEFPYYVPDDT